MTDVFISYARPTRSKAERIKDRLYSLGLSCFFDLEDIDGGAAFPEAINKALRESKAVLCCWSSHYFKSRWCMIECRDALARGVLIPIRIDEFDEWAPPADLKQINFFRVIEKEVWRDEEWKRALAAIGRLAGRNLINAASAIDAREQLLSACLEFLPPGFAFGFLSEREHSAPFEEKEAWAVVRREVEQKMRQFEDDAVAQAETLKADGKLLLEAETQLSYIRASQRAADDGVPEAEQANDRARAELVWLLKKKNHSR